MNETISYDDFVDRAGPLAHCDDCGLPGAHEVQDLTGYMPANYPRTYLCDNCAESRWLDHESRMMEAPPMTLGYEMERARKLK
jgi:hypothetical protein